MSDNKTYESPLDGAGNASLAFMLYHKDYHKFCHL